jgi:hypothetical protein
MGASGCDELRRADRTTGLPLGSLADLADREKAKEAAAKIVQFAEWREKLRPHRATTA